jgi:purine-binding chemotaxis protein CheW
MNREQLILSERANKLAGRKDSDQTVDNDMISVIEFTLIPETFALEEKYVTEVLLLKDITLIPGAPAFLMGIFNLRGRIISIVNLKKFFHLKDRGITELNKVIIVKGEHTEFGIIADSISRNKLLSLSNLSPAPLTIDKDGVDFISGVTSDGIILLNSSEVLSSKKLIINT